MYGVMIIILYTLAALFSCAHGERLLWEILCTNIYKVKITYCLVLCSN